MTATEVAPDVRAPVGSFLTLRQHEFVDKVTRLFEEENFRTKPEVKDDSIWLPFKPFDAVLVLELCLSELGYYGVSIPADHPIEQTAFTFGCWVSLNLPSLTGDN